MKKVNAKIRLPVDCFSEKSLSFELLSSVYEGSPIEPIFLGLDEGSEKIDSLFLEVQGEVISPPIKLFDAGMFLLDYQRFYT